MDLSKIGLRDLAFLISKSLEGHGIEAVLVGGACVSLYSENQYQSFDLDFVTHEELKRVENALQELDFKRVGRCFSHSKCPYLIDFVNPPIAIGKEAIQRFEVIKTRKGTLLLLTPTDCIKDRLASYFHWQDAQALDQAILVSKRHKIRFRDLKQWARNEGYSELFDRILPLIKHLR